MESSFNALRRRKIFRVATAYAIVAWVLLQLAEVVFDPLGLPDSALRGLIMDIAFKAKFRPAGSDFRFDQIYTMGRVFTLGFYKQGWEEVEFEQYHPSIGWMRAESKTTM